MARALRSALGGEVHPLLALLAVAAGVAIAAAGHPYTGAGAVIGAAVAYANAGMLLKRITMALDSGDAGLAMISMQVGLLVTFTVVAGLTVGLVMIDRSMAVAMGVSFFATQTAQLAAFFFTRRLMRDPRPAEGKTA